MDVKGERITVDVYIFATGNVPTPWEHPIMARRAVKYISRLPGLLGVYPDYPRATLLVFGTRTHAEKAMDKMRKDSLPVANHLMRGTAERDSDGNLCNVTVVEPADGWTEADKEQLRSQGHDNT